MFNAFHWECPYCGKSSVITDKLHSQSNHAFACGNKDGYLGVVTRVIVCASPECRNYEITGALYSTYANGTIKDISDPISRWKLKPQSNAKPYPDYIPAPVRQDYEEACLIKDLSPKASATLARRCLQGMINDYWSISRRTLYDEIKALEEKVDPLTWKAIDAVRSIGNIGAHMEKDINLIIDVDADEAASLIGLIEILIKDWYIARHERELQLKKIVGSAEDKKSLKTAEEA